MKIYTKKDIFEIARKVDDISIPKSADIKKAKSEFMKDLQSDSDYLKFKKNANTYDNKWNEWEDKMDSSFDTYKTVNVGVEDPYIQNDYDETGDTNEMMGADSAGSFEAPIQGKKLEKKKVNKIHNLDETIIGTGEYDVPLFGTTSKGRKNPLKIEGPNSLKKSRAVKDKNFPKWGGPGGVFIKIKEKCKKFPYCNQGDINAIEPLKEIIDDVSQKYGISREEVKEIILKEIKQIFI